jgi:hypothetical protein
VAVIVDLVDLNVHSQMGDDDTSATYAAELRVIEMALAMALESTAPWAEQVRNGVVLFADTQSALKALEQPRMPSG